MTLNERNYYSREANEEYMSASQFKAFDRCEAAALAELRGETERKPSTALMVGSYVDAYFAGELAELKATNPDLFTRGGALRAEYWKAQKVAERIERDELARMLLGGAHQTIKTGEIGSVKYKAKFDSLLSEKQVEAICERFPEVRRLVPFGGPMIVDLKCMRNFDRIWDEDQGMKVNFIQYWGYDIQGAIYQALDGRNAPFVIVGASKEEEPDIIAVYVPDSDLEAALNEVKEKSRRFAAIKRGEMEPNGCGRCEYCRNRRKLTRIDSYISLDV